MKMSPTAPITALRTPKRIAGLEPTAWFVVGGELGFGVKEDVGLGAAAIWLAL